MINGRAVLHGDSDRTGDVRPANGAPANAAAGLNPAIGKQIVLGGGCARSGTQALANLINLHPDCAMGYERYNQRYRTGEIDPELYTAERYVDVREGDTHRMEMRDWAVAVAPKFETATVVGDKTPLLHIAYDAIFEKLEGVRVVCILRNPPAVAASYQSRAENPNVPWGENRGYTVGMADWNASIAATLAAKRKYGDRLGIVSFERVLFHKEACDRLFEFLGVAPLDEATFAASVPHKYEKKTISNEIMRFAVLNAKIEDYRELIAQSLDHDQTSAVDLNSDMSGLPA